MTGGRSAPGPLGYVCPWREGAVPASCASAAARRLSKGLTRGPASSIVALLREMVNLHVALQLLRHTNTMGLKESLKTIPLRVQRQ